MSEVKKRFKSPRRKKHQVKQIIQLSLVFVSLMVAVLSGVLLERKFGSHEIVETQTIVEKKKRTNELEVIAYALDELTSQLSDIKVKLAKIEFLSHRIAQEEGLQNINLDASGQKNDNSFDKRNSIKEPRESAEQIGRQIDKLLKRISLQEDKLKVMEFFTQVDSANLQRIPTIIPVSLSETHVSSGFGMRMHPITGELKLHSGIDLAGPIGTPIIAPGAGLVSFVGERAGYGLTLDIDHGNHITTRYAHLSKVQVEVGQIVSPRDIIAQIGNSGGSTGSHLHFEVRINDVPLDPLEFIGHEYKINNFVTQNAYNTAGIKRVSAQGKMKNSSINSRTY
ncbi:putative peptidase [Taylorella equigenitalis 14/56]|uniref:Peptidase M23B n=2 Tax=Taylorella equigenitalis TaxID=29575 RepID=A0A654KHB1_TAYEM|nr:M23 family metallopeptidase [Taylorella equigenitalis]ADU91246.1 peptidase M23B [Taylorella equigenitalis MCE9]ASY42681.1 peptidase M23 [Taylorella equigenitalis]RBA26623.1 M23 family peptidase [Taylorella equigenitalis]WDU49103.1 peptidoglycan DD-metalloendopeptidase family protein [Taylorella equigenitalis]WDU56069.1 peptidoglycan DD-metalloendopeptidase family protein [Taylorella equigenitalis]